MNESTLLDQSLQYEPTIRHQLKHPRPETHTDRRPVNAVRTRLASIFQAASRMLEPERSDSTDPIKG